MSDPLGTLAEFGRLGTGRRSALAGLRLLEPPTPALQPMTMIMVWTARSEVDAAHRWLRGRLVDLAAAPAPEPVPLA